MNDYRELCETLRLANSWQFAPKFVNAMLDAADAIEQLVKERDAAIAEIEQNCYHCKHSVLYRYLGSDYNDCEFYKTGNCKCRDKWEWRGVQE